MASGASSVDPGHSVRRNLEWDSAADLGLGGGGASVHRVPQKQAAASLSTLEKLAIGNYSNYLGRSESKTGSMSQNPHQRGID